MNEEMKNNNKEIIISVESRKGGVGKTTAALSAAKVLAESGYAVLYLDCDLTGTDVTKQSSPLWKNSMCILKNSDNESVNLIKWFREYCKNGNINFAKDEFDKSISNLMKNSNTKKSLFIGSSFFNQTNVKMKNDSEYLNTPFQIYDDWNIDKIIKFHEEENLKDYSLVSDKLQVSLFKSFLEKLIISFKKSVSVINKDSNICIIIDNSPGFHEFNNMIHEWLIELGPKNGKFMFVTSIDQQDIYEAYSCINSLVMLTNVRVTTANVLTDCYHFKNFKNLNQLFSNESNTNATKNLKNSLYRTINSFDTHYEKKHFPYNNFYLDRYKVDEIATKDYFYQKSKMNFVSLFINKSPKNNVYPNYVKRLDHIPTKKIHFDENLHFQFFTDKQDRFDKIKKDETTHPSNYVIPAFVPSNKLCKSFVDSIEGDNIINLSSHSYYYPLDSNSFFKDSKNEVESTNINTKDTYTRKLIINELQFKKLERLVDDIAEKDIPFKKTFKDSIKQCASNINFSQYTYQAFAILCLYYIVVLNGKDKKIDDDLLDLYSSKFISEYSHINVRQYHFEVLINMRESLIELNKEINNNPYVIEFSEKIKQVFKSDWDII